MKYIKHIILTAMALVVMGNAWALQLHITTPSGQVTLEAEPSDSFEQVKSRIEDKESTLGYKYLIQYQHLYYNNIECNNTQTLNAVGITSGEYTLTMTYDQPYKDGNTWVFTMPYANQLLEVEYYDTYILTLASNGNGTVGFRPYATELALDNIPTTNDYFVATDLTGFVTSTKEEALSWNDVPATGYVLLFYDVDIHQNNYGDDFHAIMFQNGSVTHDNITAAYTYSGIRDFIQNNNGKVFYTTQSTVLPAGVAAYKENNTVVANKYNVVSGTEVTVIATPDENYHFVKWTDENNNVMGTDAQLTFTITGDTTAVANFAGNLYTISDIPQGWTVTANGTTVTVTNGTAEIAENAEVVLNPTTNVNLVRNVTLTGSYSIVQQSNGTWKFTMPAANTSVEVVYWNEPGLAYSAARDTAFLDIPNHTFPTLTNNHNLDVHYGSSNTSVATVNTDGSVTVLTYGQTVIYAVHDQSETDGYGYDSVFYTLTIPVAMVTTSANVTTYYHQFRGGSNESYAIYSWIHNNNSTMTMLADVDYYGSIGLPEGNTLTLDLNGHGITFNGHAFGLNNTVLTIVDTTTTTTHYYTIQNNLATVVDEATYNASSDTKGTFTGGYITGGNHSNTSSITLTNESRLDMYGGTIIGTTTSLAQNGGGVNIQSQCTFRMYGGNIIGNRSKNGGGVFVNGGTMEFYGGVISQNFTDGAGSVYVYGSSSKLIMSGGTIANNTALWGGAIMARGGGTVTITGGTFSNNLATGTAAKGGALTNYDANNNTAATFNISGALVFSGNMCNNEANDVYLVGNVKLNIPDTATLSNTTPIIIDMATPGVFTNGLSGHGDASKFTSGNAAYAVTLTTDQEAQLSRLYTLTMASGGNGTAAVTTPLPDNVTDNNDGTYTVPNGTEVTVKATANSDYHFVNWTDEDNNVMGTDAQITLTITGDTTVQGNFDRDFEGTGTEDDPYLIPSIEKWNLLADKVKAGKTYEGKYFRQTANIGPVTKSVGYYNNNDSYNKPFSGTYDGQGHYLELDYASGDYTQDAPFLSVNGATIKNLHTKGMITTKDKYAAGLISRSNNYHKTTNVINCRSSVEIRARNTEDQDGTHGGFVGVARESMNIIGCVFDGKLVGQYGSYARSSGGFIGWTEQYASVHFKDCIFAPEIVSLGDSLSCTFSRARKDTSLHFTNCYYTQAFGNEQGKQMDSITAGEFVTSLDFAGVDTVYTVSGITAYANNMGLKYGDILYAGNGDVVELSLSHADRTADGFSFNTYSASNGGIINSTTLTMPDTSTVISANYNSTTPTTPGLTPEGEITVLGNKFVDEHGQIVGTPRITEHGEFIDNGNITPPVHLIGKFSVSGTQKVYFSPANLQYTRTSTSVDWSTGTWSFLAHQYSSVETAANPYCTENYGDKTAVGLFGWGTWGESKTPNITSTSNANYTWSTDFQGTLGGYSDWRTLTKDEWTYLLTTRATGVTVNSTNNARYTLATINTGTSMVKGMIIFPDGFTGNNTDGVTWGTINAASNYTTTCTTAGWNALESANCLFLPATGWRAINETINDCTRVEGINSWGYYWTNNASNNSTLNAYVLKFDSQDVEPDELAIRRLGFSVRLVRNAE